MPPQNTPDDNKQISQRFIDECWNQGKMDVLAQLLTEQCRYHDPVFPSLTGGAQNIRTHLETCRKAFPDLTFTIAERNEVVNHWTVTGTHQGDFLGMPPTNRKATVSGISISRIEGSRIAEMWASWNLMSLMQQLGIVPAAAEPKAHA